MPPARRRRGTASLELSIVTPVLMLLAMGTSDIVGVYRAQLRVDSAARQLGQLVSQCNRIVVPGDANAFWNFTQRTMGTVGTVTGTQANGAVVLSAIGRVSNANRIAWQQRTGSSAFTSQVGAAGGNATLPTGMSVPDGQTLFVTEVFLRVDSWPLTSRLTGDNSQRQLRGATFFYTRAPDAPSLQQTPGTSLAPSCTA